jgi:hypothetical protein
VYLLEAGGTTAPGLAIGSRVRPGDTVGSWVQDYRLVEIRSGGAAVRRVEQVLDVKGAWVERGASRTRAPIWLP